MTEDIRVLMDDFYAKGMEMSRTLMLNPARDAQFCGQHVSQCLAMLNMKVGEQWGTKLREIPIVHVPEAIEEIAVEVTPPAKPKKGK